MKRRTFLGATGGSGALASIFTGCGEQAKEHSGGFHSVQKKSVTDNGMLAGMTLEKLREQYRYELFDDFLPFVEKYVVDHQYGAFMTRTDHDGTNVSTDKSATSIGRGIWLFSFLYNNFVKDEKYLEIASKAVDFILKHKPSGDDLWPNLISREGEVLDQGRVSIAHDCYIGEGLAEFGKATGEQDYFDLGRETMFKCLRHYDRPDYQDGASPYPGARNLWYWMLFMWFCTCNLDYQDDPELEKLVVRCVDAIMNYHYDPEYGLFDEYVNHDLSRIDNDYGQIVTGHGLETMWMVMFEAARRRDKTLFETAAERLKRSCEVFWDDVYGGMLAGLNHVDKNIWGVAKSLWLQEEILIGTLFIVEHTGAEWAKDWYSKMYNYVLDKFPLKEYGHPIWILYADRKVTFEEHTGRVGNFHHPRQLMINMLILDRMISRGGKVSDLFA